MRRPIVIITILVAVLMAAIIFWLARDPGQVNNGQAATPTATEAEVANNDQPEANGQVAANDTPAQAQAQAQTQPEPKDFCERDFSQVAEREADVPELQQAGGLVHIFEREARLDDPYGCADFYLDHGLAIDAVDPRTDGERLTGLFYAIKRNDPRMLNFMIDHGADLQKRAGAKDTRAMGYAYYLALQDQRIDRNEVIGILDSELTRQASRDQSANDAGQLQADSA